MERIKQLDVADINERLQAGLLLARPRGWFSTPPFYEKISEPVIDSNGDRTYQMGYFFDNDIWLYTAYMTIPALRDYVEFFTLTDEI